MRQRAYLFQRLQAAKKIKAYTVQNVDNQQELDTNLEATKAVEVGAQQAIEERASMLRKAELENETLQVEIHQLKLEIAVLGTTKVKVEENGVRLKLELEQTKVNFVKDKKELGTCSSMAIATI